MDQDLEHRLAMLENQVVSLQECVEESEVNAESAQMELVKEKAKVESLQYELNEQIRLFALKFEQEHEDYEELKTDFKKLQEDRQKDRESFQKTTQSLQKSVLEKTNLLKEKEESNSILRKEAMDLVTRYLHTIRKVKFLSKNSILQNPNIFTSFSHKFFLTIFLVKSKLSTAKKSKTFHEFFTPKKTRQF